MSTQVYTIDVARKPKTPPNPRAAWVRLVREETASLSQEDFAEAIKVARPTVSNWERGRYIPEWGSIEKIMRRFPEAPRPPFGPTRDELLPEKLRGMTDEGLEVAEYLNPLPETLRQELMQSFHRLVQLRLARGEREAK